MRLVLAAAALAIGLRAAVAQVSPAPAPASIVATLDSRVDASVRRVVDAQRLVAVSVAIVKDGRVVLEKHAGFEDRERGVPASTRTMYRWASISKPVTAVAAMLLAERGKLDLDADVRGLVPEWPEKEHVITTRQLLCHQGGVVHYANGKVIAMAPPADVAHPYEDVVRALETFKMSPLVATPGTTFSYSTHGYILASAMVQRGAGEPYWAFVKREVAARAGMTTFRPDYQWEEIPHRAVGYRLVGEEVVRSSDTDVSWKLGGGGFISNVGDLARFGLAMLTDGALVKPETRTIMWTAQKTTTGAETGYGLGFQVRQRGDRRTVSHSGSQEKAATYLLLLPDEGVAVAIMCNTQGASLAALASALAESALEDQPGSAGGTVLPFPLERDP